MESPCIDCGTPTVHTEDDVRVRCETCQTRRTWLDILRDIQDGKLEISDEYIEELKHQKELRDAGMGG